MFPKLSALSVLTLCAFSAPAQLPLPENAPSYSPEVEARIKQVEQLVGQVKFTVKGAPVQDLKSRMVYHNVNGLIKDNKVEWAKGYGWADEETQRPVTTETPFQPGSISKSLNGMTLMKLVQDGKIELNPDINTYLSSWKFPYDDVSKGKKITVGNLLSHTAGLTVHGFPGYYFGDELPTIPQVLDGTKPANTKAVRSMYAPGTKMEYSGGGVMISQLVAMDITGMPYDELVRKTVFEPLGMTRSMY